MWLLYSLDVPGEQADEEEDDDNEVQTSAAVHLRMFPASSNVVLLHTTELNNSDEMTGTSFTLQ